MAKKKGAKGKRFAKITQPNVPQDFPEPPPSEPPSYDIKEISAAVASLTTVSKPILVKLCRLCESKDGPFLNIFECDKILAKKINRLLPIVIDEYDKLPHKICFRCSAKVEELNEFIDRCIRTQENLKRSLGESKATIARKNWEEKLKESKTTNDDYCESLIKQALEKIGLDPNAIPPETESGAETELVKPETPIVPKKRNTRSKAVSSPEDDLPLKSKVKDNEKPAGRTTRSRIEAKDITPEATPPKPEVSILSETLKGRGSKTKTTVTPVLESKDLSKKEKVNSLVGMVIKEKPDAVPNLPNPTIVESDDDDVTITDYKKPEDVLKNNKVLRSQEISNGTTEKVSKTEKSQEKMTIDDKESKDSDEFDIMQHISTIKVGGAGLLYQCKLCKRNFLKKEVVLGHNCVQARKEIAKLKKPEPKVQILLSHDQLITQALAQKLKSKPLTDQELIEAFKLKNSQSLSINSFSMDSEPLPCKAKPGPASKKKMVAPSVPPYISSPLPSPVPLPLPPSATTSVELPSGVISTKNRFKLIPGPNNTFTLIEDTTLPTQPEEIQEAVMEPPKKPELKMQAAQPSVVKIVTSKANDSIISIDDNRPIALPQPIRNIPTYNHNYPNLSSAEFTNLPVYQPQPPPAQQSTSQETIPYPVGLFQTIPCSATPNPPPFSTPAMKKQSYTIVQTGHPGKLVISTKPPQTPSPPIPPPVTAKTKRGRKPAEPPKQPFQVTLEDSAPQKQQNDFFTFVNVDPLLQPSYVLPTTTNIIQESQITTSTHKPPQTDDVYSCELCPMKFTREKKLLAHLQTHYAKIDDDEDYAPTAKKRARKS